MRYTPHKYQERAERWILEHPRCGLFLEMGLGKTVVTLSAVSRLQSYGEVGKVLVVAPKKVAEGTWESESRQWDHLRHLRTSLVLGTPAQRERALEADADIYVTSRDQMTWINKRYNGRSPFDMLILDELGSFKNPSALRFKALRQFSSTVPRVVGLTGTPTPNGLKDLWAQIYCIDRGKRLGPYVTRYRDKYFHTVLKNHIPIKVTPKEGAMETITDLLSDICLTMRRDDYLELPPCVVTDVPVVLSDAERKRYKAFERDRLLELPEGVVTAANAAALMGKLSQYTGGAVYGEDGEHWETVHTAKLEALTELVEGASGGVLVYYQYRHEAERIEAWPGLSGLRLRRYDGPETMEAWNRGEVDVLLAHPASTAYGLNLQRGGHTIVWYTVGWNLEHYQQANARLYRQGQTEAVMVYNLTVPDSVDELMTAAIRRKDGEQSALMGALSALTRR